MPMQKYVTYAEQFSHPDRYVMSKGKVDIRTRKTLWSLQLPSVLFQDNHTHSSSLIDSLQQYAEQNCVLSQGVHGQCDEHLQSLAFLVAQWPQIADLIDPPVRQHGSAVFCIPEVNVPAANRRGLCQIDLVGTTANGRILIGEIGGSGGKRKQLLEQCVSVQKALSYVRPIGMNWTYEFNSRMTHAKLRAEAIG